ncbi:MAG: hypothetical protein ACSHW1_10015 [Yoonia sp.]|uniref:hypothetical protein n=1 Tax=Yoonia sp. TaxID=2212373 RepID=UPI003EFA5953
MSYVLDKPRVTQGLRIAIVSRQIVDGRTIAGRGVALRCDKTPAYVIVQNGKERTVLDMTGVQVEWGKVSTLCPAVNDLVNKPS